MAHTPNLPPGAPDHVCWGGHAHSHPAHALEVDRLGLSYREVVALRDVSFRTSCGRSVALVGPNGAGKSSLLKTLAGIYRPDTGHVRWRGAALKKASRELAYLPQREEIDWNFPITVHGLVEMGRYPNLGWWRRFQKHDEDIVERALNAMELQDLTQRQISALSGGQQQRAFIARALAQEAHVLLLDEPFTGLDRSAQETLQRLLIELKNEGRLIIASHHDLNTVTQLYDDVLLIRQRVIAFGAVAEAFTENNIAATYRPDAT